MRFLRVVAIQDWQNAAGRKVFRGWRGLLDKQGRHSRWLVLVLWDKLSVPLWVPLEVVRRIKSGAKTSTTAPPKRKSA